MKAKNILIPAFTLIVGLVIGYFVFNSGNVRESNEHDHEHELTSEGLWTCSMHPQIRKTEPGQCPICGMDLIPLEENTGDNPLVITMSDDAVKLAQVQTTIVGIGATGESTLSISGKIEPNETNSSSIVSHIPGRIEKLYVSFTGERVYKGQKIATIYSPSLITAQKELLEAAKMKNEQPKLYEAALNKLRYWKISDAEIDEILRSGEIKENFHIYAEHSGVVQQKRITVGDHVNQGGVIFDLQNLNTLWVVFDVYEKDLPKVAKGNVISFTTESVPGKTFVTTIDFVDPIINSNTRTAKIRGQIDNAANLLKPEMFVNGQLNGAVQNNELISIPKTAVMWTGKRSVVYVQVPEMSIPSYEYREVTLGSSIGDRYQIIDGLSIGEKVVTNGAFIIDASAQLNNQSSMMNHLIDGSDNPDLLPDYTKETPEAFKAQLEELNHAYLLMKDAFVQTDAKTVVAQSKELLIKLNNVEMSLLKGESHNFWMKYQNQIKKATTLIKDSEEIDEQRMYFVELSRAIVDVTKSFGVNERVYFVQYCPMSNDKKGAFWLSEEKEIRNPYYGSRMLTCGSIELRIDNNFKNVVPPQNNAPMNQHNH